MELYGFGAGPYQANTYVVAHAGHAFVVDPGMHAAEKVREIVREHDLTVDAIVLTHGHIDHTREAGDLAAELRIPVYIHAADAFMLNAGEGVSEQSRQLFDAENMLPITDLSFLDSGKLSLLGREFAVHHAPGHSPGCVIIVGEGFALTGDVLFKGAIGRTDLLGSDPAAMTASLRGPVWDLADSLSILPGHGPTSTMRAERLTNPYLRELGQVS